MLKQFLSSALVSRFAKRQKIPVAFPYYDDVLRGTVQKMRTAYTFKRQIIQMYGEDPDTTTIDFEALMSAHPEFLHNPLAAYKHCYTNGFPDAPAPAKKIIFVHLQRTAGSTFTHLLRRNVRNIAFRRDFVNMPNESPIFALCRFRELQPAEQEHERDKWDKYDAFGDHSMYGMHEMLRSSYTYVTILRHPIDRLLSYYRYVQRERTSGSPEELKEAEMARNLSITEFMYHPFFRMKLNLEQSYVQMLSGCVHPGGHVFQSRMDELLEIAKNNLNTFGAVLLQEEFDASAELMCKKFGWEDELYIGNDIVPRNQQTIGDQTHSSNARAQLTEKEYVEISDYLKQDIALYYYGKQLFERQLRQYTIVQKNAFDVPNLSTANIEQKKIQNVGETEPYMTSIGPVTIALRWVEQARKEGVDPDRMDIAARHAYYTLNLRRDALLAAATEAIGGHTDLFRLWLLTLHAHNVCDNVIERDIYGLRELKEKGFKPRTIVDIGAHIGAFSLFAHHLWPEANIIAAEACSPDKLNSDDIGILQKNLEHIPTAEVHRRAIFGLLDAEHLASCRSELLRDTASHWMELGIRGCNQYLGDVITWNIQPEGIRSFLQRIKARDIDLLKLCCDGAEVNILRELAASDTLGQIQEIRGEWHGDMGKAHVPDILHATHEVTMTSIAPAHVRGMFRATLRPAPLPPKVTVQKQSTFGTEATIIPKRLHPVPMIAHDTSLGAVYIQGKWAVDAERYGIAPQEFNKMMSYYYFKYGQRGAELVRSMQKALIVPEDMGELWLEYLHSQNICMQVIDRDCYGIQQLKDAGHMPKTIVDIGGHVGTFSLHAHVLWPEARIVTVEPTHASGTATQGAILQINTKHIPNIHIANVALIGRLDEPNAADRLKELQQDVGYHWLERGVLGDEKSTESVKREGFRVQSVASFVRENNIETIDLLKIDCEGPEMNIMRELDDLHILKDIRAIRGEWHGNVARKVVSSLLQRTHDVQIYGAHELTGLFSADLRH